MNKDCENCINSDKNLRCRTMLERPDIPFCWADKEMAIKREEEIIEHSRSQRLGHMPKTSEYQTYCFVIMQAKGNIQKLSEK